MKMKEIDLLARQTAEYWADNCPDEDFMDYCADDLCGQGLDNNIINEVLSIIEEKYLDL